MKIISLYKKVGSFAENKDAARDIRTKKILPLLEKGDEVAVDFKNIDAATQSFIHALISDLFRKFGSDVLERLYFKNCNEVVKKMIGIVCDYMQEGL